VYLSITDQSLYDAVKKLDKYGSNTSRDNRHEKPSSEVQEVRPVPSSTSGGSLDPWTEALRVALDPASLCQALEPEKVEEMQLFRLPTIDKNTADRLPGLSVNNTHHRKH
jgi:hypothetical protein